MMEGAELWILWQYCRAGKKRSGAAAVVDNAAVVFGTADIDAVSFRRRVRFVDIVKIAPVLAAVTRRRRTWYL